MTVSLLTAVIVMSGLSAGAYAAEHGSTVRGFAWRVAPGCLAAATIQWLLP